jgi:hypothetical protein
MTRLAYTFRFRSDIRGRRNTIRTYGRNPAAFFRFPIPTPVVKTVVGVAPKFQDCWHQSIAAPRRRNDLIGQLFCKALELFNQNSSRFTISINL